VTIQSFHLGRYGGPVSGGILDHPLAIAVALPPSDQCSDSQVLTRTVMALSIKRLKGKDIGDGDTPNRDAAAKPEPGVIIG
jgi:hypothetical protein